MLTEPASKKYAYLSLLKNPLSRQRGVVKLTPKDKKWEEMEWEMYALKKDTTDRMIVFPATSERLIFPTHITLKKINH